MRPPDDISQMVELNAQLSYLKTKDWIVGGENSKYNCW